jgi:diguanylate cyclase (GGDEF)-like protein
LLTLGRVDRVEVNMVSKSQCSRDEFSDLSEILIREQYYSLTRLVPVLYIVVITATVSLCLAFNGTAPAWLIHYLPIAVLMIVILRLRYWIKARAFGHNQDMGIIRRDIRGTQFLGPSITFAFTLIGIGLMPYSDPYQQSLAVVAIWITAIASAFCLATLPSASKMVVLSAGLPIAVSFLWSGNELKIVLTGLFAIITCLVIYILSENYAAFTIMVQSRAEINEKRRQAEVARQTATTLAYTDYLTNLANRRYFEFLLNERVSHPEQRQKPFAVGIIDLDGFKPVNDIHGHRGGDSVLVETAARLNSFMAGRGQAARIGGDEFAVLVEGVASEDEAVAFAEDMQKIFVVPIAIEGGAVVQLSSCCGFSIYPVSTMDAEELINQADMALYRAKAQERGCASVFTADYQNSALEHARLEQGLRLAVSARALSVHFQPIVDLGSGRVTGFEALARWHDAGLGHVSPAVFIPIAEKIGLIEQLTEDLLRKAVAIAATWPDHLVLSFNLSAAQLVKPGAGLKIISILGEAGLPAHRFEVEVTETILMKNIDQARRTLECLKAANIGISLDDFGTGYSSLSQIKDLPLDKVKIDKSFVDHICGDAKMGNLVRAIISMCDNLNLQCVAEGIEEGAQLDALKAGGCTLGQGYLFSRPVPSEQIAALLARTDKAAGQAAA